MLIILPLGKWLDIINILGVLFSILGFLYVTYQLFKKIPALRWILRIVTPVFLGILILTSIGIADFAYSGGPVLNGAILYGLVGVMIGAFNGIFVKWDWDPSSSPSIQKQFFLTDALVGLILSFVVWFIVTLVFGRSLLDALYVGAILATAGGITAGYWRFFNWEPPPLPENAAPTPEERTFSWKYALIGLICGLASAVTPGLILGFPIDGLALGGVLAGVGAIGGGYWRFLSWEPRFPADKGPRFSWKAFSWKRGLIGAALGVMLVTIEDIVVVSVKLQSPTTSQSLATIQSHILGQILITGEFLVSGGFITFALWPFPPSWKTSLHSIVTEFWHLFSHFQHSAEEIAPALKGASTGKTPNSSDLSGEMPPQNLEDQSATIQSGEPVPSSPVESALQSPDKTQKAKPPLFSAGGFLLGFVSALLFGFLSGFMVELAFGNTLLISLSAALTAASFIGLAGAVIGAFSRYLFWRADSLDEQQLLGTGSLLTLFGFLLQIISPIFDLIGIH